jgi:hypothetical protein
VGKEEDSVELERNGVQYSLPFPSYPSAGTTLDHLSRLSTLLRLGLIGIVGLTSYVSDKKKKNIRLLGALTLQKSRGIAPTMLVTPDMSWLMACDSVPIKVV